MLVRVPGNLLLFGEYAVTLSGGKGLAVAVDSWVEIEVEKSSTFAITSQLKGPQPLIDYIVKELDQKILLQPAKIHIDSSSFFYADGRKKGFGSSAAVTIGLVYALLKNSELDLKEVFPLALAIHRGFQGGRGSGYDIAASYFGGAGLFTGGLLPTWQPLLLPYSLYLLKGTKESATSHALALFETFQKQRPEKCADFLAQSNSILGLDDSLIFEEAIQLNRWLHQELGLRIEEFPPGYKPLGAGSEIAAGLTKHHNAVPLNIAMKGLTCT